MKLIKVKTARIVWLLDVQDLNPRGLDLLPLAIGIKERYNFQKLPTLEQLRGSEVGSEGFKFLGGVFSVPDVGTKVVVDLEVYGDGLVASTRSDTKHTSAFLHDLLTFSAQKHGLTYDPSMITREIRFSEMVVESTARLDGFEKLTRFSAVLSEFTSGHKYEFGVLQFWTDPSLPATQRSGAFRFERLEAAPFQQNRFYSSAPVHSDQHMDLLTKFETIMAE